MRPELWLAAMALTLAACGGSPPTSVVPIATDTPSVPPPATTSAPPTQPPAATASPLPTTQVPPTATPTTAASATPTVEPTPDPNEGLGDVVYQDRMDGSAGWLWGFTDDAASFGVQDGQLKALGLQTGLGYRFSISPDSVKVGDQQVRVTAQVEQCEPGDEYGLLFRGRADETGAVYDFYALTLNCAGAARAWLAQAGQVRGLAARAQAPGLTAGAPAEHVVLIWMAGDEMRFYVNDQYLFTVRDAFLAEGFYGVLLDDREAPGLSVSFSSLEARSVTRP